jgi:hypothetical protein
VDVDGAARRLAHAPGRGRPILVLPGLYAGLDEGLFVDLAARAAALGRPVALLEDRLAGPTLRLNGGEIPGVRRQGLEIAAVARLLGEPPDTLALSAGVAGAFAAGPALARVVGWSGVVDPDATATALARDPVLDLYYRRVHRRAFERARLPAPSAGAARERLSADGPPPWPCVPFLLAHAVCDPVAPASALAPLRPLSRGRVVVLPVGGHLGFGASLGDAIYLEPLVGSEP